MCHVYIDYDKPQQSVSKNWSNQEIIYTVRVYVQIPELKQYHQFPSQNLTTNQIKMV